jgi:hypothetical protein
MVGRRNATDKIAPEALDYSANLVLHAAIRPSRRARDAGAGR